MIFLSPSRIEEFNSCSFYYGLNRIYHVPSESHPNTRKGTVVHTILELLLKERRREIVKNIIKNRTFLHLTGLKKIAKIFLKRERLDEIFLDEIDSLVLVGLSNDFFGPDGCVFFPEMEFKEIIKNGEINFGIRGKIDQYFIYKDNGEDKLLVRDFKTDSREWSTNKKELNIQHYMYILALKQIFPKFKLENIDFEFIFLRFPKNPLLKMPNLTEEELNGVSIYLNDISKVINSFGAENMEDNYAAEKGFVPKEEGFGGLLKCGHYAKVKGQLKKNGEPMFHCPYKFGYDYYGLFKDRKQIKSSLYEDDLIPQKGEIIKKLKYKGCKYFNKGAYGTDE